MTVQGLRIQTARGLVVGVLVVLSFAVTLACSSMGRDDLGSLIEREDELFVDGVRTAIAEPARADQAVELLRAFRAREVEYRGRMHELRTRLFALNSDYDARRSDFEVLRAEIDGNRRELAAELVKAFSELKEVMTADEWAAVFDRVDDLNEEWEELAS